METEKEHGSLDEFLKKNKISLTIFILIAAGIFYWGYLRPSDIRNQCATNAQITADSEYNALNASDPTLYPFTYGTSTTYNLNQYNEAYANCLTTNGLGS